MAKEEKCGKRGSDSGCLGKKIVRKNPKSLLFFTLHLPGENTFCREAG